MKVAVLQSVVCLPFQQLCGHRGKVLLVAATCGSAYEMLSVTSGVKIFSVDSRNVAALQCKQVYLSWVFLLVQVIKMAELQPSIAVQLLFVLCFDVALGLHPEQAIVPPAFTRTTCAWLLTNCCRVMRCHQSHQSKAALAALALASASYLFAPNTTPTMLSSAQHTEHQQWWKQTGKQRAFLGILPIILHTARRQQQRMQESHGQKEPSAAQYFQQASKHVQ